METLNIKIMLEEISNEMTENKEYLIDIDNILGDGDLGLTMADGFLAAYDSYDGQDTDLGKVLFKAGKAMMNAVPSTMGTLMSKGLMEAGKSLKSESELDANNILLLLEGFFKGVSDLGKAEVGEKTFLDGFYPGLVTYKNNLEHNMNLKDNLEQSYLSSKKGFEDTKGMLAKHGRAAFHGEKSKDYEDPGAAVAMLIFKGINNSYRS